MIRAKVTLVHPSNRNVYRGFSKGAARVMPIGLLYVAAALEEQGHDLTVIDAEAENLSTRETAARIGKACPNIVGFMVTTPLVGEALRLASGLKAAGLDALMVMGGPHASAVPYELAKYRAVDCVVVGEGEQPMQFIAEKYEIGGEEGPGRIARIVKAPPEKPPLDELPFPARHLVRNELYRSLFSGEPYTLMVSSRGCPHNCVFCGSKVTFGRGTRYRSVGNVLDELGEVVDYFGIHDVTFSDDTFTLNRARTIALCDAIREEKLDLRFKVAARVDSVDREVLGALRRAGCWQVSFGVESAKQGTLDYLRKGITPEQSRVAVRLAKEAGLGTYASFILGVPGESVQDVEDTVAFARELDTDYAQFTLATPLPGTELWERCFPEGSARPDYNDVMFYFSPTISGLDPGWLAERQRSAYREYDEAKGRGESGDAEEAS